MTDRRRPAALVTGASSGIGAATALALAPGWRLALVARRGDRLAGVADAVRARGGEAHIVIADLADAAAPARVAAQALAALGGCDALVNNAGVFRTARAEAIDAAHADALWALNVRAPMLLTAALLPALRAARGTVVNVSSVAAETAFAGCGAYGATKAALEAWSRSLREELRPERVRVAVVAPGATATEAWGAALPADPSRLCSADDIAAVIRQMLELPATANIDRALVMPPGGAL